MKKRLLAFLRFTGIEARRILRFTFRHTFSWYGGLFGFLFLIAVLAWIFVYVPTIGEAKRIDAVTAEFKTHGCRSIHSEAVSMFETHWLLKHFKLEKKVLQRLTFGPGAVVPKAFLEHPPYLPDLSMITFENSNPTDDEFVWTVRNPAVQWVILSGEHRVSYHGFHALEARQAPLSLCLQRSPTIENDLECLARCELPQLHSLVLSESELNEKCFDSLSRMTSLIQIAFLECTGFTTSFTKLDSLRLQSLLIADRNRKDDSDFLTDEMYRTISAMTTLEVLTIPYPSRISEREFEALKLLPHLKHVRGLPPDKQAEFDELIRLRIESTP